LHNVWGPVGPLRHSGVDVVPQLEQHREPFSKGGRPRLLFLNSLPSGEIGRSNSWDNEGRLEAECFDEEEAEGRELVDRDNGMAG
jgi:hypothetical protein